MAYLVVQYARYLAFKCNDTNRAVEIFNQAISKCTTSKTLYLSFVNFLKHLDGLVPDVYSKIIAVFEKALETVDDKREVARFYMEYLSEYCQSVSYLRTTEATLKHKNLLENQSKGVHATAKYQAFATS